MSATPWLDAINQAVAMLDAQRHRCPRRIRIHPLDIQALMRKHGVRQQWAMVGEDRLFGCPIIPDCGVERGKPVAEYAE